MPQSIQGIHKKIEVIPSNISYFSEGMKLAHNPKI